jgi:hypothetical protein
VSFLGLLRKADALAACPAYLGRGSISGEALALDALHSILYALKSDYFQSVSSVLRDKKADKPLTRVKENIF